MRGKITILMLIYLGFYGLIFFPNNGAVVLLLLLSLLGFWFLSFKKDQKNIYEKIISCYLVFTIISCLISYIINKQDLLRVFVKTYPLLGILSYFVVKKYNLSTKDTEKLILTLSVFMAVCYIIQWLIYPIVLFRSAESNQINEFTGIFRMRFVCTFGCYILLFYGFNLFYLKGKYKYLMLSILGAIPIIIMGFRSLSVLSILFLVIMLFFCVKRMVKYIKYAILFCIFLIAAYQTPLVKNKVNEMMERQMDNQNFGNDDYVRNIAVAYYEDYFWSKPVVRILGGGIPLISRDEGVTQRSNEYQHDLYYAALSGILWNDLGLLGLSYMIGIPALLLLIFLCVLIIRNCKGSQYQYLRFSLITIFVGSIITSQELYREGNFLLIGVIIYLLSKNQKSLYNENRYLDFS